MYTCIFTNITGSWAHLHVHTLPLNLPQFGPSPPSTTPSSSSRWSFTNPFGFHDNELRRSDIHIQIKIKFVCIYIYMCNLFGFRNNELRRSYNSYICYIYIYIYKYKYIYIYIYIHIYIYIYIYVYIWINICTYIYMYIYVYVALLFMTMSWEDPMCVYIYTNIYVCIYMYKFI